MKGQTENSDRKGGEERPGERPALPEVFFRIFNHIPPPGKHQSHGGISMKRKISLWFTILLVVTALIVGIGVSNFLDDRDMFAQLTKIKDVMSLIQQNYVDSVDIRKLTSTAITSMLSQLD